MSCNCGKNKENKENEEKIKFRTQDIKQENTIANKMTMMQNFASAIVSRGVSNNKVSLPVKQLRVASCFGNMKQGGELPPCEHLKPSSTPGQFFCGGCGCGDRKGTWLIAEGDEYSKLDYPKLACPLQMPGFSNYKKSESDEGIEPVTRRYYLENNITYKDLEKIPVTIHAPTNK
jgi:hypothetical protein